MTSPVDFLEIQTPLPATAFKVVSLSGSGSLSQPFRYKVGLRSGLTILDVNQLLDNPITITIKSGTANESYLNGIVIEIIQTPSDAVGSSTIGLSGYWDYQIVIVPRLQFLQQTSDCRFFENQKSVDIVKRIFQEFGISNIDYRLSGTQVTLPYTVMFNETYLEFLDRILAQDGLFYFFEHTSTDHLLVIGDSNAAFRTSPASPLVFASLTGTASDIQIWKRLDSTTLGSSDMSDYNPAASASRIIGEEPTVLEAAGAATRTHYHWPTFAPDTGTAQKIAKRHMQAHEVLAQLYVGKANIANLYAGDRFTLTGDPTVNGAAGDYVVAHVGITVLDGGNSASEAGPSDISTGLTAFPAKTPWQPIPLGKPSMAGFYSATVIGPAGEEIYTDDLGRIKVQFPWDHRDETTSSGSFWLRVVQPWSGGGWGAQFIPRVGQEVAVTFLEGDIDRPVAVGALYNSTNTPIFPAADKNKSGFRSRSTKGGGAADYNEISFDDTKGSEVLLFHAQKDHLIEVENDQTMTIDHNRTVKVKNDEAITILGTQTVKVTKSVLYESEQSITLKVGSSSIKIDPSSITLSATMIKVEAEAKLETTGAMVQHSASATMTQQAPIIKVN